VKGVIYLLAAIALLAVSVWLFYQCGSLLALRDYFAGVLHLFGGFATVKAGVELARLAAVLELRS
jgi:hypothetical protein